MFYLDTSAALKLVIVEQGSTALRRWLADRDGEIVSSDLLRTELVRATRLTDPGQMVQARAVLDALILLRLSSEIFERAANLQPETLRSLDALHLAAALELGDDLDGIVTYDARLADGARAIGMPVIAPR